MSSRRFFSLPFLLLFGLINLLQVEGGFNTLPLFKCNLNVKNDSWNPNENDDDLGEYAQMIYRFIGYANIAYPFGNEFQYPIWSEDYSQSFPNKCWDICLGGQESCNVSTVIRFIDGTTENRIGCTQNVFYPFMAGVTYAQCQNVSYSNNAEAQEVIEQESRWGCNYYTEPCWDIPNDDQYADSYQYTNSIWYKCGTEMTLTFLDKTFAEVYTEPYDIIKILAASFFSCLKLIENFTTAGKLYVDHGINLSLRDVEKFQETKFTISKFTDTLSLLIKGIISIIQVIVFAYVYYGSMDSIYSNLDCAGNMAGSYRFIFVLTHLTSPMFLPMLVDASAASMIPNKYLQWLGWMLCCSVLVIPVLLLLGGALFALPSLATAILPVSIVHFLTILIMIALGILSAILVTILSAGVSFSIDFFSSGIRNFVKTKIFRSSSEDNSFSREKIDEENKRKERSEEWRTMNRHYSHWYYTDPTFLILLIGPLALLGLMAYVNSSLCETCNTVGKNDTTGADGFRKFFVGAFFAIYKDLNWKWDIVKIDWTNFSWIEITGIPRINITFVPPSFNHSFPDYIHSYMFSWSLKILSLVIGIPLKLAGKILDALFGLNYSSPSVLPRVPSDGPIKLPKFEIEMSSKI